MSIPTRSPIRLIDPRGQRFGAGSSAIVLAAAVALDLPILVALVGLALGVSSALGTRYFVFGRPWPTVRRLLRLGPPSAPEPEVGPRFAQALGATFLALGAVMLAAGIRPIGWLPVGAVIALQTLLAVTGYCLGCRLYGLQWWVPGAVRSVRPPARDRGGLRGGLTPARRHRARLPPRPSSAGTRGTLMR